MDGGRIVLLGKTGTGKSSTANTIFRDNVFEINNDPNPGTSHCAGETKSVNGKNITLINTPGFFDPDVSKEELKEEILKCIVECAPGPHVFLILLKVEKFTVHENQVIDEIRNTFSKEAFKHAVVVFTHGDQLHEEMKIEEFVSKSEHLSDLVKRCSGRCHVIDNKYWKNNQQDKYRSNQFQLAELLNTIDKIVKENNGGCYTNEMLKAVCSIIKKNEKCIGSDILKKLAGITIGALLGALLGVSVLAIVEALVTSAGEVAGRTAAVAGAFVGGCMGYDQADQAESIGEAIKNTAKSVHDIGQDTLDILQLNKKFKSVK